MTRYAHKIGAICYMLWGLLHVGAGALLLYRLSQGGAAHALDRVGTGPRAGLVPRDLGGVVAGVVGQHAWNLLWFGLFATIVGATLNWRNSRTGYWCNLAVVSAADIGFIFAIMVPRYMSLSDGLHGPVLWVLAVVFSTIGIRARPSDTTPG